jgi:hypothetical protein
VQRAAAVMSDLSFERCNSRDWCNACMTCIIGQQGMLRSLVAIACSNVIMLDSLQ